MTGLGRAEGSAAFYPARPVTVNRLDPRLVRARSCHDDAGMPDTSLEPGGNLMPDREIFTVSRLNREARSLLERGFGSLWLEGEVSNLSRPASGHWYFSLKDAAAQVRCAMFRSRNQLVRMPVQDGLKVIARGRVSLYEARGEFQVLVEHLEEAGEGALRRRFEELKRRLAAEGLFDARHRKPLPRLPRRIGVITSPSGAAIRDVLHVLQRRFPAVSVLLYPVAVQGAAARGEIIAALRLAGQRADCDVLILARGGGSLEDLQAFNDESVARAVFACPIPVVSGIGHEVDFTIVDFVADERAPTPSGAAERVVPDRAEWLRSFAHGERRVAVALQRRLRDLRTLLGFRARSLSRAHPGARLRQHAQRLDDLDTRVRLAARRLLGRAAARVAQADGLLRRASPVLRLRALRLRHAVARRALAAAGRRSVAAARARLDSAIRTLHATGPQATLARGYAVVTDAQGRVLCDATATHPGATVGVRLWRGSLAATVTATTPAALAAHDARPGKA
jgi:exodeoxyribonuclease VII large subunit